MPNASYPSSIKIKQKKIKKLALEPHFCYRKNINNNLSPWTSWYMQSNMACNHSGPHPNDLKFNWLKANPSDVRDNIVKKRKVGLTNVFRAFGNRVFRKILILNFMRNIKIKELIANYTSKVWRYLNFTS